MVDQTPFTKDQFKDVVKEALKEWLDEKFLTFGKWSLTGIAAAGLALLAYFLVWSGGWHR